MTVSAKTSLMLGVHKAGFRREGQRGKFDMISIGGCPLESGIFCVLGI